MSTKDVMNTSDNEMLTTLTNPAIVSQNTLFIIGLLTIISMSIGFTIILCIIDKEREHFIDLRIKNMDNENQTTSLTFRSDE